MARLSKQEQERLKELAHYIYTSNSRISQKEVAEKVGVTTNTIGKWIKLYNWDTQRTSLLTTRSSQLALLYEQLEHLNNEIASREGKKYPDTKEANTIIQLTTAIKNLEKETSIGEIIQVSKDLVEFIAQTDYDLSKTITKILDDFINHKMK